MAINRSIIDLEIPINHAVSIHADHLPHWLKTRKLLNRNYEGVQLHTIAGHDYKDPAIREWAISPEPNTSGLAAICIAQELGYNKIRVIGIPADNSGHYYDLNSNPNKEDFYLKFPFETDGWVEKFKSWNNVEVSSGNLLKLFPQLPVLNSH